jgi:hypothetical protein
MRINPWQRHYHSDPASLGRGEVTVSRRGTRIIVAAPYDEAFRTGARGIDGVSWRGAVKVWTFPRAEWEKVRDLIVDVFGVQWIPEWMREGEI